MEEQMMEEAMPASNPEGSVDRAMLDSPIPGQSLANSPDTPMPFETPPEYTNYEEAQEHVVDLMTENSDAVIDVIAMGVPVSLIGSGVVMKGFAEGKWNPDLMLLLIEPAIYTAIFIAENAGIEYVLDLDEEFEHLPAESRMKAENFMSKASKQISREIENRMQSADIKDLVPQSLLSKPMGGE